MHMDELIQQAISKARQRALDLRPIDGEMTWQQAVCAVIALYDHALHEAECEGCAAKSAPAQVIEVNKITHRIRCADETEFFVRVIIEPKDS